MNNCFIKSIVYGMGFLGLLCFVGLTVPPVTSSPAPIVVDALTDATKAGKENRIYYKITVILPAHGNTFKPFNYVTWGYVRNSDGTLTFVNMNSGSQVTVSPPFTIQEQRAGKITRNP